MKWLIIITRSGLSTWWTQCPARGMLWLRPRIAGRTATTTSTAAAIWILWNCKTIWWIRRRQRRRRLGKEAARPLPTLVFFQKWFQSSQAIIWTGRTPQLRGTISGRGLRMASRNRQEAWVSMSEGTILVELVRKTSIPVFTRFNRINLTPISRPTTTKMMIWMERSKLILARSPQYIRRRASRQMAPTTRPKSLLPFSTKHPQPNRRRVVTILATSIRPCTPRIIWKGHRVVWGRRCARVSWPLRAAITVSTRKANIVRFSDASRRPTKGQIRDHGDPYLTNPSLVIKRV